MKLIDGKAIAAEIQAKIKRSIEQLTTRPPALAVILVGENPASEIYIKRKRQACQEVGIRSILCHLLANTTEEALLQQIDAFNQDPSIDGILVQLPLPHHICPRIVTLKIDPHKDVDGFHPINVGKLLNGESDGFVSCTPLGIKTLLEYSGIEISGKHVVIYGRSNIVGKPLAALLMQNMSGGNATVTVLHRYSQNIIDLSRMGDIVIAAIGQPLFIKKEMIKKGAVVVDVGINKINNPDRPLGYQIVGDVDFEDVKEHCSYITPVPGGVGPLTIAMLLQNTLLSYQKRHDLPTDT